MSQPEQTPTSAAAEGAAHRAEAKAGWTERLHGLGPIIGLVLLCIAGALLNSDFATPENAMNVLTRTAFIGIIAVGMCFVIISGGIDLSVGSLLGLLGGLVAILTVNLGWNTWLSVAVVLAAYCGYRGRLKIRSQPAAFNLSSPLAMDGLP